MITLDYKNCLNTQVGEHGISAGDLERYQKRFDAALDGVNALHAAGKLGFVDLPDQKTLIKNIQKLVKTLRPKFENLVVIGIGGSALGNQAVQQALRHPFWNLLPRQGRKGGVRLFVPDNVDPTLLAGLLDVIDVKKTIFNVISKSGTTAECVANYLIVRAAVEKKVGRKKASQHFIFTTDEQKGFLREIANREGIPSFPIPSNVGGRFSVLTAVGLLSAAFTGVSIEKLLKGAGAMRERCKTRSLQDNPAGLFAALHHYFYGKGKPLSVMMPYAQGLYGVADWYRQLWAESLGKRVNRRGEEIFVGPTPIKALGVTDQHSQVQLYAEGAFDKVLTFLSVEKFSPDVKIPKSGDHYLGGHTLQELLHAEEKATRAALTKAKRPNLTMTLPAVTEEAVGELFFMLEMATAYAGDLFDIDAFDQPGVEQGKIYTYALMGRSGYDDARRELATLLK